jgi:CheY-like chemotaxis protein
MKILVVDDEPEICKFIKSLVEPLGVEARICSDSREAALIVQKEKFDGIMLDAMMPNIDGCELARKIRGTPPNENVPIIMITGQDDVDAMRRAFKAGATFFIGKPFSREKIYALFRTARGTMLAERRRYARLPVRTTVACMLRDERFNVMSISVGGGGMELESSGSASVDDFLVMEFNLPDVKKAIEVTGKVRAKEASGQTSLEFTDPSELGREAIRDFVQGKVKE